MADAYTVVGSVSSVQTAYDRLAGFALRPQLHFDQVAEVMPTRQAMPGLTVKFTLWTDMAIASTALNESVDVDAVALADSQITVTLVEYGNAAITSARVRAGSFLSVDEGAANLVGYNAGVSQDAIAVNTLKAATNVRYATGQAGTTPTARNTVEPGDTLCANDVRRARTDLAGANVMSWPDQLYRAFIHPDVAYDLRRETGAAAWRDPHTYESNEEIWNGTIGAFEGFSFVESPQTPVFADAGSSTTLTDVYATIFLGRQALAKAYSTSTGPNPQVVRGAVIDKLKRFEPLGWYWLGGYSIYRQAAIRRVESSSSIGVNA